MIREQSVEMVVLLAKEVAAAAVSWAMAGKGLTCLILRFLLAAAGAASALMAALDSMEAVVALELVLMVTMPPPSMMGVGMEAEIS
jgi:hypothetical protein